MSLQSTDEGGGPILELDVKRFENLLGHRLPSDYRDFLLVHNGGRPRPGGFDRNVDGEVLQWAIHFFFSIKDPEDACRLDWYWLSLAETRPPNVLAIAGDDFGNLLYLGYRGNVAGKVFFGPIPNDAQQVQLELLADSFTEFLGRLY